MKILLVVFCQVCSLAFCNSTLDWISLYLPHNPVIVEAGAHIGTDTVEMARQWPAGKIYAFEPNLQIYPQLERAAASLKNVSTFPIALGDRIGVADFYLSKSASQTDGGCDAQSSLLPPSKEYWRWDWIEFDEPVQVPVTTLDQWAKDNGVTHVDFLWLDLQGSEFQVLQASPDILKTVTFIQTEFSKLPFYEGTVLFDDLTQWLEERGFWKVYEDPDIHGNAMFWRSNLQ